MFARVKSFSHQLRQNASFNSFAADDSVYYSAQQEDVTKEESGSVGRLRNAARRDRLEP